MVELLHARGRRYELNLGAVARGRGATPTATPADRTPVRFADRQAALRFLRDAIARDPRQLRALRRAVSSPPGQSDGDVLEHLAAALVNARWRLYPRERPRPLPPLRADEIAPPIELPLHPAPVAPVEEPPPPEAPPEWAEVAAQAQVLREAAALGTPFCAECEKARLTKPAAAPPPSEEVARLDAAAQAQALREAATAGAPFCAECEKARLTKPAAAPPPSEEAARLDAAAQAQALREAATAGAPFCAECEKARLARTSASAAAPPPPASAEAAHLDAGVQAQALRSAAASGAPFCEECEKARREAA